MRSLLLDLILLICVSWTSFFWGRIFFSKKRTEEYLRQPPFLPFWIKKSSMSVSENMYFSTRYAYGLGGLVVGLLLVIVFFMENIKRAFWGQSILHSLGNG